jgi:putative ABC transport system substrate-binding protein
VILLACVDAPSAAAAKATTKSIPIVFATGADPVKTGLVDSFSRSGGNLTGVSFLVNLLGRSAWNSCLN